MNKPFIEFLISDLNENINNKTIDKQVNLIINFFNFILLFINKAETNLLFRISQFMQ